MKVIVCRPERAATVEDIGNDLESMQRVVGGYIETFYPFDDDVCIVCNDEGKFNGMLPNRGVVNDSGNLVDIIFGTFFICGVGEEDFTDIPATLIDKYFEMFHYPERFSRLPNGCIVKENYFAL